MTALVQTSWPAPSVATITLTDTSTPNHNVTFRAIGQLADALSAARAAGARVLILASGVEGTWLNHAHLGDLRALMRGGPSDGDPSGWFRASQELSETDVISIAAISGDTSGGGCELGWACDLRIAEAGVRFSQPEVIMGIGPGIGGASRLRRLIGPTVTAEMILLGLPMTAERLYELGGINLVVPRGHALQTATEWGCRLAGRPGPAVSGAKQMLREGEDLSLPAALENDQRIGQRLFQSAPALETMRRIQARYDQGESLQTVLWDEAPG